MSDELERPQQVFWPGPWHFVQASITQDEMWSVNRIPVRVTDGAIVQFMLTDDALHFIEQGRAIDLGVWNSADELIEAAQQAEEAAVKAAPPIAPAAAPVEPERAPALDTASAKMTRAERRAARRHGSAPHAAS